MLGPSSPVGEGWVTVQVRLENESAASAGGFVELRSEPGFSGDSEHLTRVPFALGPRAKVSLELPTHGFSGRPPELSVRLLDAEGHKLSETPIGEFRQVDPLLYDLNNPSRLAATVRGLGVVLRRRSGGAYRTPLVGVSSPTLDPATGEPILPRWAAGYSNATLVVASARQLAMLSQTELVALTDWVLSGGALALVVERPEDLRASVLEALLGSGLSEVAPAADLLEPTIFYVPTESSLGTTPLPPAPVRTNTRREQLAPPSRLTERLHGYSGGQLRPTPWGAVTSYGLGEVHLLAFPTDEAAVTDRWTQLKVVDLVRHAWERQAAVALPLGQAALDDNRTSVIRRLLDPNENMRWTIVVSALVLLLYAGLAGPLNFFLASRRGRPLRAVSWLPVWAAATMLTIVAVGIAGKGVRGRARKLSLVEAGAGMARGAATRFRGLYASSARELSVRPISRGNLLDVASDEEEFAPRALVVDRDGVHIEGLHAKPWQTLVIREDGAYDLAGGLSIVQGQAGELLVKNRTARDLLAVILKSPGGSFVSFARIADGATVSSGQGDKLTISLPGVNPFARPLGAGLFKSTVDRYAEGLGAAWEALSVYASNEVDWWPDDVPVLIAQIEGGDARASDSGLRVDIDRMLLRVVGFGGVP
ncbi:MAG TPA: hypothetical protein VGP93_18170 [Polyangiaceae bacterium]|nr:hypothetical protein [Polyangiaceae bacterium]